MKSFWKNKRVLITGHTGFKGAWLTLMLRTFCANVAGYALAPLNPSLFHYLWPNGFRRSFIGDVLHPQPLIEIIQTFQPEIVFHMAAQTEVCVGYEKPLDTYLTNAMGTVQVLEILRNVGAARAILVVTTDKVYQQSGGTYGEFNSLCGGDPYSSSKVAADHAAQMYGEVYLQGKVAVARSGNVIGGGDWAANRLIPNCFRAMRGKQELRLYDPDATRPWQHVLDCLNGYIMLAERLYEDGHFARPFNFAPDKSNTIEFVARLLFEFMDREPAYTTGGAPFRESKDLALDSSAAHGLLKWQPKLSIVEAVKWTAQWHKAFNSTPRQMPIDIAVKDICQAQIKDFFDGEDSL